MWGQLNVCFSVNELKPGDKKYKSRKLARNFTQVGKEIEEIAVIQFRSLVRCVHKTGNVMYEKIFEIRKFYSEEKFVVIYDNETARGREDRIK